MPVGEDQRQHLELTRDLARALQPPLRRDVRACPSRYIVKDTAKILDLQDPTAKMSKSASSPAGIVELLDDPARQREEDQLGGHRLRPRGRASTRRTSPASSNLLTIYSALTGRPIAELEASYAGAVRRPEEGPGRGRGRLRHAVPGARGAWLATPPSSTRCSPRVRRARARSPPRRSPPSTTGSASSRQLKRGPWRRRAGCSRCSDLLVRRWREVVARSAVLASSPLSTKGLLGGWRWWNCRWCGLA